MVVTIQMVRPRPLDYVGLQTSQSGQQGNSPSPALRQPPIHTRLQVLLPRFGMKGRMNYDPEEDWLDDNKGQPKMDLPDFFDAMVRGGVEQSGDVGRGRKRA